MSFLRHRGERGRCRWPSDRTVTCNVGPDVLLPSPRRATDASHAVAIHHVRASDTLLCVTSLCITQTRGTASFLHVWRSVSWVQAKDPPRREKALEGHCQRRLQTRQYSHRIYAPFISHLFCGWLGQSWTSPPERVQDGWTEESPREHRILECITDREAEEALAMGMIPRYAVRSCHRAFAAAWEVSNGAFLRSSSGIGSDFREQDCHTAGFLLHRVSTSCSAYVLPKSKPRSTYWSATGWSSTLLLA